MKTIRISIILLISAAALSAGPGSGTLLGFNFMAGGRYDNLRMCVGSPPGVKGGPIADVMFTIRTRYREKHAIGFKLPVMRPILFGAAFKMLQFEPEFIYEYKMSGNTAHSQVIGGGLGASLHYGPDYKASLDDTDREDFFAAGPFMSGFWGLEFPAVSFSPVFGIRVFYTPLFSEERNTGTVLGAALEGHFSLSKPE